MIRKIFSYPACVVEDSLVVADIHLGIEKEIAERGISVPSQTEKLVEEIKKLLELSGAERLVILGDLKHEIPLGGWDEKRELVKFLSSLDVDVVLVKGNHDSLIEKLLPELEVVRELRLSEVVLAHGHTTLRERGRIYLLAHTHPAIELHDGIAKIKEKVWLEIPLTEKGREVLGNSKVVVMPAFSKIITGVSLNAQEKPLGTVFSQKLVDFDRAEVFLLDSTCLGELKHLKIKK